MSRFNFRCWLWLVPAAAIFYTTPRASADIIFNGISQGSNVTISDGDSILGSGSTAGVVVGSPGDVLYVTGGSISSTPKGLRVLNGYAHISGGTIEQSMSVEGGVVDISGGLIRHTDFDISGNSLVNLSGGTVYNSMIDLSGPDARINITGGSFSWLYPGEGSQAHIYGIVFSLNGIPADFGDADTMVVPDTTGYMSVTYEDMTVNSHKLQITGGGSITLHLIPEPGAGLTMMYLSTTLLVRKRK
jgi:hypothetical protein